MPAASKHFSNGDPTLSWLRRLHEDEVEAVREEGRPRRQSGGSLAATSDGGWKLGTALATGAKMEAAKRQAHAAAAGNRLRGDDDDVVDCCEVDAEHMAAGGSGCEAILFSCSDAG